MTLNTSTGTIGAAAPSAGAFPANHKFYERKFLEALQPEANYDDYGTKVGIPSNESNTIVNNKISELSTTEGSPLTEGVTPTEQTLTLTRIETSINQFGAYLRTTDRLSEESINGLTAEFAKRLGWQGARTMNLVYRDGLLGGTNVRRKSGAATIDLITASGVVVADFEFMWNAFKIAHVRPLSAMANGSVNVGTLPVNEAYIMLVPVEARPFLETLDDSNGNAYVNVETYSGQVQTIKNEIGRFREFRFVCDTEAKIFSNAAGTPQDIARCLVFGQGVEDKAYKVVDLAGGNMELITKPLGSSGTLDPINQRASMGWKAKGGTFIVQDLYMFRYEFSIGAT